MLTRVLLVPKILPPAFHPRHWDERSPQKSSSLAEKAIEVLILVRTRYSGEGMKNERDILSILFVLAGLVAFVLVAYWLWAGK